MSRSMQIPSHQKLAEKLTILCDRGNGMLTRIYNIKKMLGTADSKPTFLSDKALEPAMKAVLRKFPNIDTKSNSSAFTPVTQFKVEIIKSLSLYYDTFVDILDFKDHTSELLTTMDACSVQFDITLNYDLTKSYLDLIATYLSIMILISRVEDRKFVLGLFAAAHEFHHNSMAPNFPRLGQMILDYEQPLRKLCEDFIPHAKLVTEALISLQTLYPRRCQTAAEWRTSMSLSLVNEPTKLMNPAQSDTIHCEYLSLETIERWIISGFMLCHQNLAHQVCAEMWKRALHNNYVMTLCRDEVLHIQPYIINYFEGIKNYNRRVAEVKELYHYAVANAPLFHKERRKFLRTCLKELAAILSDQPGLMGPKALYVFMALSLARDEVSWLLRHYENQPPKRGNLKVMTEDFQDRQLPELLFHIEELRSLVKKYNQVMQRYYIQYLHGYDAAALNQMIQSLTMCSEDESDLLGSFHATMTGVSVKQVEMAETFDFTALRLDWFRLQCYTSVSKSSLILREHSNLANHMNTVVFHTKMVDYLDEMLKETSDLSFYCFFTSLFEHQFRQCLEFTSQHRYSIAFPMVCAHFMNATHELCPEERHSIGTTSIQYANFFLKDIAEEVDQVITAMCDEHCKLADQLLAKHAASASAAALTRKKKDHRRQKEQQPAKPGAESHRKLRENFTMIDRLHMALTELCYALNYQSTIHVWHHGFVPREFFVQHLEARFNKSLVGMTSYNPDSQGIAKPTELLHNVKAMMSVLQTLENYIHIDISRVFNNVMPQQTQPADSFNGEKTITFNYTKWYLEVLLRQASSGHMIVYSPLQKAFVSSATDERAPFNAEDYADIMELRALAELIGPYGMKYLGEQLMHHVAGQVKELKKLVLMNKEILHDLRYSFNQPERMRDLTKRLQNVDNLLQRMTIIGVLLSFRGLAQEALHDTLESRIPFLLSSIKDFQHYVPNGQDSMIVNDMASAAGLRCNVDPVLCAALRQQKTEMEDDYNIACLLMVFIAVSIPKLASNNATVYKASLGGHANNTHCLAKAINTLAAALFTLHGNGTVDIEERLKEFLALASNSLLRLGQETDKEQIRNRESVYLLLDQLVQESNFLTMDLLESCFPYVLLRNAYHAVFKVQH